MKRTIKKALFYIAILSFTASCNNFLDRSPETLFDPEVVYNTTDGVETAVNGMYMDLSSGEYYGSAMHGLLNPHSGRMYSGQGASADATSLNCTTTNTWLIRLWPQMYKTIDDANSIIENLQTSTLPNKDTSLGQAYFIRGLVNFDLVRLFGAVPLRISPVTKDNLYIGKSTKQEVYQQIIEDFTKAKTLLPDAGQYRNDRPIKWAAYAYLAKVYMQLAGEDGGDPANWQKAWDEAIQVYGKYSLVSNYAKLFEPGSTNENSTESIFEIQYGQFGDIRNSDVVRMYTPQNSIYTGYQFPTFGWIRPNKETFDQHVAQYSNDPRIATEYISGSYPKNIQSGGGVQNIWPTSKNGANAYPVIRKWFDPSYNGTATNRNLTVFRYADLLLMLAEIQNELNGPTNAYQYVNLVLARARNSATVVLPVGQIQQPADYSGMTQVQFRDRIMQERKFELLSEGQDWYDARRRGQQYFLDKTITPHNTYTKNVFGNKDYVYPSSANEVKRNMLLPIPQTEIAANPKMSATDQNFGY